MAISEVLVGVAYVDAVDRSDGAGTGDWSLSTRTSVSGVVVIKQRSAERVPAWRLSARGLDLLSSG